MELILYKTTSEEIQLRLLWKLEEHELTNIEKGLNLSKVSHKKKFC